jgi:hypothetical protein
MKKILLLILIILLTSTGAYAGPSISGGTSGGGGSGDVTAASDAQTWGGGTGPVVWTFSVTGTDPTISVATGAFTLNTDLALGANDITMTGSLGATGAGKLTKIWSVDAEFTNAPTVNGAAFKPADLAIASQAAGDILYFNGTNWVRLAKDAGKYLKSGDAAVSWDTPAGSGTVDVSGTPANHYWTGWTDADTIKGFSITASKPVCSDANGDPAVCAGTEGVWQVAGSYLTSGGALGTPSSGTVTNLTGTASININGTVGATTPAAGKFTTLEASTSLAVTAAEATGGYIRLLEGTNNGTDYSSITGAADAGSYPSFTFSGSKGSEDLTLTAASDKWTIASTTGATVEITPAVTITGALTLAGQLNLMTTDADPATTAGGMKHDSSDTGASGGGSLKWFDGTNVRTIVDTGTTYTVITKTEYIPIAYAEDGAAAPATATVWADTRKAKIRVFAADADDDVEIHWMVPNDYVGGIKFRVIGFVDNATAPANTETVIFNLAGCSVGDSDDGGCTLGTGVDSTFTADATYAQHDRWSSAWSNEITVTNIAASESVMLKLFRDVDDTYAQGIGVAGIEIKYKAKVIGIAGY